MIQEKRRREGAYEKCDMDEDCQTVGAKHGRGIKNVRT